MYQLNKKYIAVGQAVLAAALFGMSAPLSKLLLAKLSPIQLSALLYLGAGIGMLFVDLSKRIIGVKSDEAKLTKQELPFVVMMVLLDVAAPISLMAGLTMSSAANASLLSNFEIVATSVIALVIFKEAIGKRLWLSIALITISSIILTVSDISSFSFSVGSILVVLACVFWGFENNCTRKLSIKDPIQVVIIKGFGAGLCALLVSIVQKETWSNTGYSLAALVLGFFAYGMSIFLYVASQRHLGAARTSTYYAVAPFIGVGISYVVFKEPVTASFIAAFAIMLIGTYLAVVEKHEHEHYHNRMEHEHRHSHSDGHHNHIHEEQLNGEHSHPHTHEILIHTHEHLPDIHHSHQHKG